MGSMIGLERPDGGQIRGYLATAGEAGAGVVVIHGWWGLNDQIMGVADRFARNGLNALAPDLFKGRVTTDAKEANGLMEGLDFRDATHQDLAAAAQHLKPAGGKVAVMGFCMGGSLAIAAAVDVPAFDAAISLYGIPAEELGDPTRLRIPFQGHFANRDDWITPSMVDRLEAGLKSVKASYEIHRYDAQHAFCDERGDAYDVKAANQAWDRMLRFLGAVL